MGSSRAEPDTTATAVAFALQELIACWNQGYEALARGDLERVDALLAIAAEHVATAGTGTADTPTEAALRREATSAHGRLRHGMQAGLTGLQDELARARKGSKALRGYGNPARQLGTTVVRDV